MSDNQMKYEIEDPQFFMDPGHHDVFSDLRQNDPVSWRDLPNGDGYWAVVKYKDIVDVSMDPKLYSSAQGAFLTDDDPIIGAMITTDPPRHNEMRRSVVSYFNNKTLKPLESWLRAECRSMISKALAEDTVEFVYDVAAHLPLSVVGKLMELSDEDRAEMLQLVDRFVMSTDEGPEALQASAGALAGFALGAAAVRRAREGQDLISAMLEINGEPLSDAEFATMFTQIAVAATETTRTSLVDIVLHLAKDQDLFEQMRSPDCNLDAAINEFLRMFPPVNHVRRTATEDHEFRGKSIKAGDKLVLYYPSANFDEEIFENPRTFDIARRPNPHLTFGVGQHVCLGFRLARMELKIFIEEFMKMVSRVELVAEPEMDPQLTVKLIKRADVRLHAT